METIPSSEGDLRVRAIISFVAKILPSASKSPNPSSEDSPKLESVIGSA